MNLSNLNEATKQYRMLQCIDAAMHELGSAGQRIIGQGCQLVMFLETETEPNPSTGEHIPQMIMTPFGPKMLVDPPDSVIPYEAIYDQYIDEKEAMLVLATILDYKNLQRQEVLKNLQLLGVRV